MNGNQQKAQDARKKAAAYQTLLEDKWWSTDSLYYHTFWTKDNEFYRGEGVPFVLWFNATSDKDRICATVNDILKREWNVENMSAFPMLFYRLGYYDEAYRFLVSLPKTNRSEYPEVSYGIIEGTVSGVMGITSSAINNSVTTCSRLPKKAQEAEIKNVPIFDGYVTVKHQNRKSTRIKNHTSKELTWEVAFVGEYTEITVDKKAYPAIISWDAHGNPITKCSVVLPAGSTLNAEVTAI